MTPGQNVVVFVDGSTLFVRDTRSQILKTLQPIDNAHQPSILNYNMGIRGLGGFLKWKVPSARKTLKWNTVSKGQRWGIDCSCLLYRARGSGLSPLTVVASLIVRLRTAGVVPVVVFDGRPPASKSDILDQRRVVRVAAHKEMAEIEAELSSPELTDTDKITREQRHAALQKKAPTVSSSEKDALKQFLYAAGVLFVTATGEADDLLAYLARSGDIQAIVSTDTDMLPRGVSTLIMPETPDCTVLTEIHLKDVLSGLSLTYPQFVDACMLMGSDYSGRGWRSVEPSAAVNLARRGVVWNTMDVSGSVCLAMERGVDMLMGSGVRWTDLLSEKQLAKWTGGAPPCEPENLATLAAANGWPATWLSWLSCIS